MDAAGNLGMLPGSALYADLEPFRTADAQCVEAVRGYLSGWTRTLHEGGYLAGAYGALTAGLRSQSASYGSDDHARLDAVWSAEWNGTAVTKDWTGLPDEHWPVHQRIKQYRGDHDEVHGGYRPAAATPKARKLPVCRTPFQVGEDAGGEFAPASPRPGRRAGPPTSPAETRTTGCAWTPGTGSSARSPNAPAPAGRTRPSRAAHRSSAEPANLFATSRVYAPVTPQRPPARPLSRRPR